MDKKANNFCVTSKGYCFLCLNQISPSSFTPGNTLDVSTSSFYSLQDISRYLKMDMSKVFIDKGPVPSHLLAKVQKSRLKVELCEGCGNLVDNVSKHCRRLEKLKLEIASDLEIIHGKMFKASETGMTEKFRKLVGSELNSGMGGWMEILEALRMEAMQKSSLATSRAPRLRIQKLTSKAIYKRTFRIPQKRAELNWTRMPDPGLQRDTVTMPNAEKPNRANWLLEDDFHNGNSFVDDLNDDADDSVQTFEKNDDNPTQVTLSNVKSMQNLENVAENNLQQKFIFSPENGKYKCPLCTMEYTTEPGVRYHYTAVHRKIRIKCKICGQEFTRQHSYNRHHQNVHAGVRFQCQVCKKIFSLKHCLMTHQRKAKCGIGTGNNLN